ncbi:retinoblastoma-like protein 1, partial [Paragonimus westermani]
MDFDYEEPIEKRFEDLCQDLCIEGAIREEAWEKYKVHPTGTDLFRFTWLLFIKSRASFPAVTDDLVNSYHLLACCLDWVLGAVMLSRRSDLVNLELTWLPKDFLNAAAQKKTWCPPHDEPPCMLRPICQDNGVHYVECKTVKEHFFRPFILRLIEKEFIKLSPPVYGSLLESSNFDITLQNLNNNYEEYIIGTGDFDERIYLSPNAAEEIGSTGETAIESTLGLSTDLAPSARRYMLELTTSGFGGFTETTRRGSANAAAVSRLNGGVNFSNPEARSQNLNQLQ